MCGYMSQFESVQNKIRNGYLFKVCFCRIWGWFFKAIPFKLFPYIVSKTGFSNTVIHLHKSVLVLKLNRKGYYYVCK